MPNDVADLREHYDLCMDKAREWGLTPFEVDFHIVPADKMYEIASYGVPGHFSHWTYGRDFWRQKTSYDYGRSKIYELVINSNPAQAFLLDVNSTLENMFVIAHVIGHSDFFANNVYFDHTNRQVEHSVSATADRFREYELKYGRVVVEEFIDSVMTISEHVDPYLRTKKLTSEYKKVDNRDPYEDLDPTLQERRELEQMEDEILKESQFPFTPERDLLGFIAQYGRLKDWQRDVILSIRRETMYFLPQMQTKIMNEGWASVIHRKLMHEIDPLCDPGGISFANLHSGVLNDRAGALNPYWLGFKIFHRIIERWDDPTDEDRDNLSMEGDEGWEMALEARTVDSDESFLRNYLDQHLVEELNLFAFGYNKGEKQWEVTDTNWERVRDELVASKANMGLPYIVIDDANYQNLGMLHLTHVHDGRDLHKNYAEKTLLAVSNLWGRPAYLKTLLGGKETTLFVQANQVHYK
jgi:stage V sporulation protein R